MASSGRRYAPLSLVTPERDEFVPELRAVTLTLGSTAPVASVTVPVTSPAVLCAKSGPARHRLTESRKNNPRLRTRCRLMIPPVQLTCTITLLGGSLVGPRADYQEQFHAHNKGYLTRLA